MDVVGLILSDTYLEFLEDTIWMVVEEEILFETHLWSSEDFVWMDVVKDLGRYDNCT